MGESMYIILIPIIYTTTMKVECLSIYVHNDNE